MTISNNNSHKTVYDWTNKTILIAEDDFINYKFLEISLAKTNAKLIWAKNGKEAVDIVSTDQQVDIILMDIQMPIMNGYEATKLIKNINPKIPIIAQTAYAYNNEGNNVFEAGCDAYMKKPLNPFELLDSINKFLFD